MRDTVVLAAVLVAVLGAGACGESVDGGSPDGGTSTPPINVTERDCYETGPRSGPYYCDDEGHLVISTKLGSGRCRFTTTEDGWTKTECTQAIDENDTDRIRTVYYTCVEDLVDGGWGGAVEIP